MPYSPYDAIRRIQFPVYLIAAFLSAGSVVELLVSSWPIHVHELNWRLSLLNSAAGATGTELLALLMLLGMGLLAESRAALLAGFWYCVLGAVAYVGAAGAFVLDSLQLRGRVPPGAVTRFDVTIGWALARFGIAEIVCVALAGCALSAARAMRHVSPRETANKIVVGVSGVASPIAR